MGAGTEKGQASLDYGHEILIEVARCLFSARNLRLHLSLPLPNREIA